MVEEFEELQSDNYIDRFLLNCVNFKDEEEHLQIKGMIRLFQKDAWNACIRWAADNAKSDWDETFPSVDKQSILNGLIE